MKSSYQNVKSLILILFLLVFILYSLNTLENFKGNTVETLENLPSWLIYFAIIIGLLIGVGSLFVQLYPYILGMKVATEGIRGATSVGQSWINAKYRRQDPPPVVASNKQNL